jgi:hypothetical protein
MLLAATIFSIIALCLYSVFAAGVSLNNKGNSAIKAQREAWWALDQMAYDLNHSISYDFNGSYPEQKSFFSTKESLGFIVSTGAGLKAVRYMIKPLEGGTLHKILVSKSTRMNVKVTTGEIQKTEVVALFREEQNFRNFLDSGFEGASQEILSRSVLPDGLKVTYGLIKHNHKVLWADAQPRINMPPAVRIELTMVRAGSGNRTIVRDVFNPAGEVKAD